MELHCSTCARNTGTTLSFPLSEAGGFLGAGNGVSFSLPLLEGQGWLKDPENSLKSGVAPSKCEMAEVLSNLSELRILGGETPPEKLEQRELDRYFVLHSSRISIVQRTGTVRSVSAESVEGDFIQRQWFFTKTCSLAPCERVRCCILKRDPMHNRCQDGGVISIFDEQAPLSNV